MRLEDRLPRTVQTILDGAARGWHHGIQLYVSRQGEIIADDTVGTGGDDRPFDSRTLMLWLSSGKPVTAVAVMRLVEKGLAGLDTPAAEYVPEFGRRGKESITLRHLLTHTAGLEPVVSGWPQQSREAIVHRICESGVQDGFAIGEHAAYDPARTWFILGEIVRRIEGRDIEHVVREEIFEPLGMTDSWMAIPKQIHRAYGDRIGVMSSVKDGALHATHGHQEEVCRAPSPGGSCRGPARELGRFYEMLLAGGQAGGRQILASDTVALMTQRHRENRFDQTFKHRVDFGLGVIVNSNRYGPDTVPYGFGKHSSESAFGHGGAQSSIGFADPAHGLAVAAIANGCPGEPAHNKRFRRMLGILYEELGLATSA